MPDPIGVIPVISFRLANIHQIDVFVPNSDADPKLFNAAAQGTVFGLVTISTGSGFSITIGQAVIASVQLSGNGLMVSIDGAVARKAPDHAVAAGLGRSADAEKPLKMRTNLAVRLTAG